MKHKLADMDTAVYQLDTSELKMLQQGQQLKEQIDTHAQQIIDHVQKSRTHLLQQVDTIVQQKAQVLRVQREHVKKVHTQLETCHKMIECSLKEWNQQQILTEKHTMMDEMKTVIELVEPTVTIQPLEIANIQFMKADDVAEGPIGIIRTLDMQPSTSTLSCESHDGSQLSFCTATYPEELDYSKDYPHKGNAELSDSKSVAGGCPVVKQQQHGRAVRKIMKLKPRRKKKLTKPQPPPHHLCETSIEPDWAPKEYIKKGIYMDIHPSCNFMHHTVIMYYINCMVELQEVYYCGCIL